MLVCKFLFKDDITEIPALGISKKQHCTALL